MFCDPAREISDAGIGDKRSPIRHSRGGTQGRARPAFPQRCTPADARPAQLLVGVPADNIAGGDLESLGIVCKALAQPKTDTLLEATHSADPIVKARAQRVLRQFADLLANESGTRVKQTARPRRLAGMFFR
jgi:hypothetical protein